MIQVRFARFRFAACGHFVSAESPWSRLELRNLAYFVEKSKIEDIVLQWRSTDSKSGPAKNM